MKRFPTRSTLRSTALATALALLVAGLAGGATAWAHRDRGDDRDTHEHHEHHEHHERHDARADLPRDGDGDRGRRDRAVAAALPEYREECGGSCHVAYPPRLLPAESWQRVMAGLDAHYGSDASIEPEARRRIAVWLETNASRRARAAPPDDRITKSAWFTHEHDEVRTAVWRRPAVASPANCAACHPRADDGDFEEHDVRIPK